MRATYNFGQVIDYYIAIVFPSSQKNEDSQENRDKADTDKEPIATFSHHSLLQALQLVILLVLLVTLSTYVLHVRSSATTSATLVAALKSQVSANEQGYQKLLKAFSLIRNKDGGASFQEFQREDVTYRRYDVNLNRKTDVISYDTISCMQDVAFWLQLGVIPTLFKGLQSHNKLVVNTARLSIQRTTYDDVSYHADKVTEVPNIVITQATKSSVGGNVNMKEGEADKSEERKFLSLGPGNGAPSDFVRVTSPKNDMNNGDNGKSTSEYKVKLPYAPDGKYHTYARNGGNFQYITGNTMDEAMASLNRGMSYHSVPPYFPLLAVITDDTTTSVNLEVFVSNAQNYTISYVNVGFDLFRGINGNSDYIAKHVTASSISSARGGENQLVSVLIYSLLIVMTALYTVHSFYWHHKSNVYSSKGLYVLDIASKICLLLCIVAYGVRMFWSSGRLPCIKSTVYKDGEYESVVGLSNDPRILDPDTLQAIFNSLRKNVIRGYWSVGFLHIVAFTSIVLLFFLLCITLSRCTKVGLMLRYFAFQSLSQFYLAVFLVLSTLFMLSLVNAYMINYSSGEHSSFRHNLGTLSNILAGVYNKQVDVYLRNYSVLHSVVVVILLVIFSYSGIIVLVTMMLSGNSGVTIESFEPSPPKGLYDNSRLLRFTHLCNDIMSRVFSAYNVAFLRRYAMSEDGQGTANEVGATQKAETNQKDMLVDDVCRAAYASHKLRKSELSTNLNGSTETRITVPFGFKRSSKERSRDSQITPSSGINIGRFRITFYSFMRSITFLFLGIGVITFAYRESRYHSVRKLIQGTITAQMKTADALVPVTFKEVAMKDVLVKVPLDQAKDVTSENSDKAPKEGRDEAPKEGSDETPKEGSDETPKEGSDETNKEGIHGKSNKKNDKEVPALVEPQKTGVIAVTGMSISGKSENPINAQEKDPEAEQNGPKPTGGDDPDNGNNVEYKEVVVKQPVNATSVVARASISPKDITTRQELYQWLIQGNINGILQWQTLANDFLDPDGVQREYASLHSRYMMVPATGPLFLEIKLKTRYGMRLSMFDRMTHDINSKTVRSIVEATNRSFGFRELFGVEHMDFPDVVEKVTLHMLILDPKANCKLYRGSMSFDIRKSGVVIPSLKVTSASGIHFSAQYSNWGFIVVSIISSLLFLTFLVWFCLRLWWYLKGYNKYHGISQLTQSWRGIFVFFMNDHHRILDLIILLLIGTLCGYYMGIHSQTRAIYSSASKLSTLGARVALNGYLDRLRFYHKSLWITLLFLVFLVLMKEVPVFQRLLYIVYVCIKAAFIMYMAAFLGMMLIIATLLFFLLIFVNEHFKEFTRGEGSLVNAIRMLFNDGHLKSHIYESKPIAMLIYPACLIIKLWILNAIFCYIWFIWPKEEISDDAENENNSVEMFYQPSIEPCNIPSEGVQVTRIADDQLDLINDDLKVIAAEEALRFNQIGKEYNKQYSESGLSAMAYTEWLHAQLATEMHEMLSSCEIMQRKMEIIQKQREIMETKVDKNLEANISLLELALADKRDELATAFQEYKAALDEINKL